MIFFLLLLLLVYRASVEQELKRAGDLCDSSTMTILRVINHIVEMRKDHRREPQEDMLDAYDLPRFSFSSKKNRLANTNRRTMVETSHSVRLR